MISFPPGFVALKKAPGYFWHTEAKALYSIKVDGILKRLKECSVSRYQARHVFTAPVGSRYYCVSKAGKKKYVFVHKIQRYLAEDYVIPVEEQMEFCYD